MQESNKVENAKAGDKVKCTDNHMVEQHFASEGIYTITKVHPDGLYVSFSHTGDALLHLDRFELIYDSEQQEKEKLIMKFNPKSEPTKFVPPKPGDKIICNNGEEFICCTLEFLRKTIYEGIKSDKPILGYRKFGYDEARADWDGEALSCLEEYAIREVIPQSAEAPANRKEEVKEDTRYTMQEIKEAWDASGWVISTSAWGAFQKNLTKINSPEYQEYLRLKAIYE